MARRAKSASRASQIKNNKRTQVSERQAKDRRRSSIKFPPKPTVEDVDSETDEQCRVETLCSSPSQAFSDYTKLPRRHTADVYHADTEGSTRPRKFSQIYGHGHRFEELGELSGNSVPSYKSVLNENSKRKLSGDSNGSSPKKVRFSPAADETKLYEKGSIPSPKWVKPVASNADLVIQKDDSDDTMSDLDETLTEPLQLPKNPDRHLLNLLREYPQPLSLSQISGLFDLVQGLTEDFARTWFGRAANDNVQDIVEEMLRFPIHDLQLKHPALYFTTTNVLDASSTGGDGDGWLKFFAHPDYRQYLVYAILGEWFTQRVFKDTSFGLSSVAQEEMHEEVDEAYLHYDSFVRVRERSKIIARFSAEANEENIDSLNNEAEKLAGELLILLTPLLPWSRLVDQQGRPHDEFVAIKTQEIRHTLVELISHCAALNWSIIRSGENGTIIRIADRLEHGKRFWPTAPMHCINEDIVNVSRDSLTDGAIPVVKMTCWARIEAIVPHGLDMIQMAAVEEEARAKHVLDTVERLSAEGGRVDWQVFDKAYKEFCWDCSDARKAWDILPEELWATEHENCQKVEGKIKNADLRKRLDRKQAKQSRRDGGGGDPGDSDPDSVSSDGTDTDTSSSSRTTDTNTDLPEGAEGKGNIGEDEPLRGSWITYYSCLNPHQVFCEWTKLESEYREVFKARTGVEDIEPARRYNGLGATVRRARVNLPFLPRSIAQSEDFFKKLWDFYAHNNLEIEWGAFVVLVVYGLSKARVFSFAGELTSAIIHLSLDTATQALAGAKHIADFLFSATPLWRLREQLQLIQVNVEDFLVRLQGALGYKWYEFTTAINNAIPQPSTTSIEQAFRDAGAEGSSSAISAVDRARSGWSHMTGVAKKDFIQILSAITATGAATASATATSASVAVPVTTVTVTTTPLGQRLADRFWGTPLAKADNAHTAQPIGRTVAKQDFLQSMQDNLPRPSDATPDVRTVSGTTYRQTPDSTSVSMTATANKDAGAWWVPTWHGGRSEKVATKSAATLELPAESMNNAAVMEGARPTVHVNDRFSNAFHMLNNGKHSAASKISEDVSSATNQPEIYVNDKFRSAYDMINKPKHSASSKIVKEASRATSKISKEASKVSSMVESLAGETTIPTVTSETVVTPSSSDPTLHINDSFRKAFDMLNNPKKSASSKIVENALRATSKISKETPKVKSKASSELGRVTSKRPTLTATRIDVQSKISQKFDEMGRHNIRDGDMGNSRRERVKSQPESGTSTVRPPGDTLVLEVPRRGEQEREEGRRRWFGRIPH